jgi:hypothetical protein
MIAVSSWKLTLRRKIGRTFWRSIRDEVVEISPQKNVWDLGGGARLVPARDHVQLDSGEDNLFSNSHFHTLIEND